MAEQRFATRDEVVAILAPAYVHVDVANAVLDALIEHGVNADALVEITDVQKGRTA
jgi:hypothetical protein